MVVSVGIHTQTLTRIVAATLHPRGVQDLQTQTYNIIHVYTLYSTCIYIYKHVLYCIYMCPWLHVHVVGRGT